MNDKSTRNVYDRAVLVEIARLYYMKGESQADIAGRFQISRSLVSKLLKRAREEQLVHIEIETGKEEEPLMLESELLSRFGLKRVMVEPVISSEGQTLDVAVRIGARAARYMQSVLHNGMKIGIEWGTSLYHMVDQMDHLDIFSDLEVIQLHGVIESPSLDIEGFALAKALGQKLHAGVRLLQAPMMVEDRELRDRLLSERKIAEVLEAAEGVDIACVGIGTNKDGANVLTRAGYLTDEESLEIKERGGTAMVSGWFIDKNGALITSSANDRIIGLNPEHYKKIPLVIGIAYGKEKSEAIAAALRGGYIDVLVTDSEAARWILSADSSIGSEAEMSSELVTEVYERMYMTRKIEERLDELFQSGKMYGTTHLCIGQEASSIVPGMALQREDLVFGTHRGHGQAFGKGLSPESFFAEMFGKATGCAHGVGGSMHLVDFEQGIMGMNGIVAGALPIAVGAALSIKMHREERVVAAFLGDGALNEGAFHESVNLASLWKVPIIFICENNQYGFSKQVSEVMANDDISSRIASYGIETVTIDGNDAELVYRTVERARDRAMRGVPQFLIFTTYRISGHSKSDKNRYRSRKEIDSWRKRCPVTRLRNRLMSVYGIEESEIIRIEQGIIKHIEEAERMARRAPEADPSVLAGLLYSDNGEVDHA